MITGFIGRVTPAGELKDALDIGTQRVRAIADRVSKASLLNQDGFALPGGSTANGAVMTSAGVDIETEMINLADEQVFFRSGKPLPGGASQSI